MNSPIDNRDDTVPAYGDPIPLQYAQASLAMQNAALHAATLGAMGAGVIRDESPVITSGEPAAPVDAAAE